MMATRNDKLQRLCRDYLSRLRDVALKHGLLLQLNSLIAMNKRRECVGTEREVQMLSRMVDDERLSRVGVAKVLGKSYRHCVEHGLLDKVKKLRRVGIYSKVSAEMIKENQNES